jgi:HEAT repeat protein
MAARMRTPGNTMTRPDLTCGIVRCIWRQGSSLAAAGAGLLLVIGLVAGIAHAAGQVTEDSLYADLRSSSARARTKAVEQLGERGRIEAAGPIATLLADANAGVQNAAITALVRLYTVRADLRQRQWGSGTLGRSTVPAEIAFEAGPLATMPGPVPAEALTGLASLARQDQALKTRLAAIYALGVLAAPAMGAMAPTTENTVAAEFASALQHPDPATRQVAARIAGRVFVPAPGKSAPALVGDALVHAMNDPDPLVRRWAMDSLGWLRYDRALQSLTERANYYGKNEEGAAALHALARIASPASAAIFRTHLTSGSSTFRVIAIEGLGRIGDTSDLAAIEAAARSSRQANVVLAAHLARFLLGQSEDVMPFITALRSEETAIQGRVYLAEIAERQPKALHVMLQSPDPWVRRGTAELLGVTRQPSEEAVLQPLLKDPSPEVIAAASEAIYRLRGYASVAPARAIAPTPSSAPRR